MVLNGRGGGIRTPDPLLPKQMRYQTALRPDIYHDCIVEFQTIAVIDDCSGPMTPRPSLNPPKQP